MVAHKLEHCLVGLAICALGVVGYYYGWLGTLGKYLFLTLVILGGFWAWVMGHAWMVLPVLLVSPFYWLYARLDQRKPAMIQRKAKKLGCFAVSMSDLKNYAQEHGHLFRFSHDFERDVVVEDLGERPGWNGRKTRDVLGIGKKHALVYDFDEDSEVWKEMLLNGDLVDAASDTNSE